MTAIITKYFPAGVRYETTIRCEVPITVRRRPDDCAGHPIFDLLPSPARMLLTKPSSEHLGSDLTVCMLPELSLACNLGSTHINRRGDLASDSEAGSPIKSPPAVDVTLSPLKIAPYNGRRLSFASLSTPHLERHTRQTGGRGEKTSERSSSVGARRFSFDSLTTRLSLDPLSTPRLERYTRHTGAQSESGEIVESSEEQRDSLDESEIYDTTMHDASLVQEPSTEPESK